MSKTLLPPSCSICFVRSPSPPLPTNLPLRWFPPLLLASVPRGEKRFFEVLLSSSFLLHPLPDPDGNSPLFTCVQLSMHDEGASRESIAGFYNDNEEKPPTPLGPAYCDERTAVEPCSPTNGLRIIKLGNMDSVTRDPLAPFNILQELGIFFRGLPPL